MKDEKPLTKSELIATLREIKVATKDDIETSVEGSERRMKRYIGKIKREIMTTMSKLALTTPTKTEFNELKQKVDRLAQN